MIPTMPTRQHMGTVLVTFLGEEIQYRASCPICAASIQATEPITASDGVPASWQMPRLTRIQVSHEGCPLVRESDLFEVQDGGVLAVPLYALWRGAA